MEKQTRRRPVYTAEVLAVLARPQVGPSSSSPVVADQRKWTARRKLQRSICRQKAEAVVARCMVGALGLSIYHSNATCREELCFAAALGHEPPGSCNQQNHPGRGATLENTCIKSPTCPARCPLGLLSPPSNLFRPPSNFVTQPEPLRVRRPLRLPAPQRQRPRRSRAASSRATEKSKIQPCGRQLELQPPARPAPPAACLFVALPCLRCRLALALRLLPSSRKS